MKYEYQFVTMEDATRHHLNDRPYHRVVAEHAAEGWRLVQVLRSADAHRHPNDVELIFERRIED